MQQVVNGQGTLDDPITYIVQSIDTINRVAQHVRDKVKPLLIFIFNDYK